MDLIKVLIAVGIFAILCAFLGLLIGIFSKAFYVKPDERMEKVLNLLPGANCGGCGYSGCSGFAQAIVEEGANPQSCKPNKADKIEEIKKILKEVK